MSRAFYQYVDQINMINMKFRMLESRLCTLFMFRWKFARKRIDALSLLIRFWDLEHSSLSSHVLTSFYLSIFHMWKLHRFNKLVYLYNRGHAIHAFINSIKWHFGGPRSVKLSMSHAYKKYSITLFISIMMFCGTNNNPHKNPKYWLHLVWTWRISTNILMNIINPT